VRDTAKARARHLTTLLLSTGAACALISALATTADAATYSVVGTGGTLHVRTAPSVVAPRVLGGELRDGSAINIVCQTRGDQVVGSTMWDRIDSPYRGYVADWYTTTPVVNNPSPGLPDCAQLDAQQQQQQQPQDQDQDQQEQERLEHLQQLQQLQHQDPSFADIAQSFKGQREVSASVRRAFGIGPHWSGFCEAFVGYVTLKATGHARGYHSALADYRDHLRRGQIHHGVPPRGAVVYWNPSGSGGAGHIGISLGKGTEISTVGFGGEDRPIQIHPYNYRWFAPYLGWAMP
jgi:hypothetical protein